MQWNPNRVFVALGLQLLGACAAPLIPAPLVVCPENPRYFRDGYGRTIRLGGHQIFVDLQDHSFNKPATYGGQATLDFEWYLDFASERGLNVLRNWIVWSTGRGYQDEARIAAPMMYERTGPGSAVDGQPKFDLTHFDEVFFRRLKARVAAAQRRGIYVIIMLFEPYGFGGDVNADGGRNFDGNVLNGRNNINGIHVDEDGNGWGTEFFYASDPVVHELQEAYVRKIIDTVGDLDNVLYEIANETHSPAWQRRMIALVRDYESGRRKQHIIYMSPGGRTRSGEWSDHTLAELTSSGADVIGVSGAFGDYQHDPPVNRSGMPAIWDGDHIWGDDYRHRRRAWISFTRGYHYIFFDAPFELPEESTPADELMRRNIGATNDYAARFADLARMEPRGGLSSSGYCLADPGTEYLVYGPTRADVAVTLPAGTYAFEWYDCRLARVDSRGTAEAEGGTRSFTPPAAITEDFALHLRAHP